MDVVTTKLTVTILFALIRFFFGSLPIRVNPLLNKAADGVGNARVNKIKRQVIEWLIVGLESFGAGVLFATCFLHMMPEVYYSVMELKKFGLLEGDYPVSQLVISLGFFSIYFAEQLSRWLISRAPKEPKLRSASARVSVDDAQDDVEKLKVPRGAAFDVVTIDYLKDKNFADVTRYVVHTDEDEFDAIDKEVQTDLFDESADKNEDSDTNMNAEIEEILEDEGKSRQQIMRCLLMVLAISLHSIFEGLAIGLQRYVNNIWYLFIAISIHSAAVLYGVGNDAVESGAPVKSIVMHMFILSVTTSCGVLLGLLITLTTDMDTSSKSVALVVLEGVSTGSILYITFFETLTKEKKRTKWNGTRAVFIASGFTLMAILQSNQTYNNSLFQDEDEKQNYVEEQYPVTLSSHLKPQEVKNWPKEELKLGQVSGVSVNVLQQPVIFHRADRVWDINTFDENHHYRQRNLGPITSNTVLTLDPETGKVIDEWGKDLFYMPHGITIDHHNNIWITDVALHQAFKFKPNSDTPDIIFGKHFEPGSDRDHLCKPTSISVASTAEIFIADGYCNSRILKYNALGNLIRVIPSGGFFTECLSLYVPHHTALIESLDRICVADRENRRVVCPSAELRTNKKSTIQPLTIQTPDMGRVFGIAAVGEIIYAVNGPSMQLPVQGFTISAENETVIGDWGPSEKFHNPHAIAASPKTSSLYVVEIGPNKVWKFKLVPGRN
ncbi:hypothetical protein FQA39_LY10734 [Lamprigera yunnana]|nr:hypothetical protein FQA39_LY10734 [Lamprigera yunnana]